MYPTLDDGKVYFQAESDSQLTKGLAALLVEGLSGATYGAWPLPSLEFCFRRHSRHHLTYV